MEAILARCSVVISELKRNPTAVLHNSADRPVAILKKNKLVGYLLTAVAWDRIHSILDDQEIVKLVAARLADGKEPVKVRIDDL